MQEVGVAHLVWTPLGPELLARFLRSYAACPGGYPHQLFIIFNGFGRREELKPFEDLLQNVPHTPLLLWQRNQDLVSYYQAAQTHSLPYLCFLNSYTQLLDEEWLAKMMRQIKREGVGLVGATSSCLSIRDYYAEQQTVFLSKPPYNTPVGRARFALVRLAYRFWYPSFPNPFIRTNGFLLAHDTWDRLKYPQIKRKTDAYRLEQGVHSLTRQIQQFGLRPLVVGRDGVGYEIEDWPKSLTFMQGSQENLLMSDNQTEAYRVGDDDLRRQYSYSSWGLEAAPATGLGAQRVREQDEESRRP